MAKTSESLAQVNKGISGLVSDLNKLVLQVEHLERVPRTEGELADLLNELAAAERDCREHFVRFRS